MSYYHQYETDTRQQRERQHRYSSGTVSSDESRSVKNLANQLKQTASFDYNNNRSSYHSEKENEAYLQHEYEKGSSRNRKSDPERTSLENNYSLAMSQMNRGDYGPVRSKQKKTSRDSSSSRTKENVQLTVEQRTRQLQTSSTSINTITTSKPVDIKVKKRSVSKKDPSEETIAVFGAYGTTGQYFLQRAMDAGYNIQAMILPGMEMEDVACSKSLKLITGYFNEAETIREVVKNATYVVCLLNDCEHEHFDPPIGNEEDNAAYEFNNLNFMHNLIPILEDSQKCRVLLYEVSIGTMYRILQFYLWFVCAFPIKYPPQIQYFCSHSLSNHNIQASSLSKGDRGTPLLSTVVKKMAISKDWRNKKKEQDKIVKYLMHGTKNSHFNYIITRPGGAIWDRPSRKKLAASKSVRQKLSIPISLSQLYFIFLNWLQLTNLLIIFLLFSTKQPGPFPITNTDLAEFTLNALKMEKIYNSCPFVVQDGI